MSCATPLVSINSRDARSFHAKSNTARKWRLGRCHTHQLCVQSTNTKTCEIASIISSLPSFKCQWMLALLAILFNLFDFILRHWTVLISLFFSLSLSLSPYFSLIFFRCWFSFHIIHHLRFTSIHFFSLFSAIHTFFFFKTVFVTVFFLLNLLCFAYSWCRFF